MRILFQGDGITDCNRNRDDFWDLGDGYVKYVVEALKKVYPDTKFEFINRGISGNRTEDLLSRMDKDTIELQPDIITLLIGINDTWHRYVVNLDTDIESFRENYVTILKRIKNETNAKLIMIEPYLLFGMGQDHMRHDLDEKISVIHKLALEYADCFVPLDGLFTQARVDGIDKYELSPDAVHPGEEGKRLIANVLTPAICKMIDSINSEN